MLKQYRYITYAEDGCSIYECLTCKATWNVRNIPTSFCPSCGIQFEGQLVWDEEKKWNKPRIHRHIKDELTTRYWTIVSRSNEQGVWEWVHYNIVVSVHEDGQERIELEHCVENGREGVAKSVRFLKSVAGKNESAPGVFDWRTEYAFALFDDAFEQQQKPFAERLIVVKPICIINHVW